MAKVLAARVVLAAMAVQIVAADISAPQKAFAFSSPKSSFLPSAKLKMQAATCLGGLSSM